MGRHAASLQAGAGERLRQGRTPRARARTRREHALVAIGRFTSACTSTRSTSISPTLARAARRERRDLRRGNRDEGRRAAGAASASGCCSSPTWKCTTRSLSWTDELRGAPPLELTAVDLQIVNRGNRHRFGLRAVPPPELAEPIDVRGDLRGRVLDVLSNWNGQFFVQLGHIDLAAWNTWIDIPVEVTHGSGAARAWLTFEQHELTEAVADLSLSEVRGRLREDLPRLELAQLAGGSRGRRCLRDSNSRSANSRSRARTRSSSRPIFCCAGLRIGDGRQHGELHANALDLAPLVAIADKLPLEDALRARLVRLFAAGHASMTSSVKWSGDWAATRAVQRPRQVRFARIQSRRENPRRHGSFGEHRRNGEGRRASPERAPGEARHASRLRRAHRNGYPDRPGRMDARRRSATSFASATSRSPTRTRPAPRSEAIGRCAQGRGEIDLTGSLSRADARGVARYIPVARFLKLRPWLERALIAGRSDDVRLRLKGNLDDFPFRDEKRGLFQVTAKVTGGTLDYAERVAAHREHRRRPSVSQHAHGVSRAAGHDVTACGSRRCRARFRT